ncbi:hypothetical protein F4560_006449 [Saccharothrix ecbatanensis]|uniref:Uncharacterized protein n=1 Tax=Saccharothrix ecbatanensis TaxID=1105145 RepID=A0A7W9M433_9PSEU|nr:hypothetical protein [Saccharothrix ecbatanensis]MBB5806681.1 hypothetical protein [Saccharothrix ecbatanensis]
MTQQDDFLGGLHYDGPPEPQVGPSRGNVRYYPVGGSVGDAAAPVRTRVSAWWQLGGFVLGALAAPVAGLAWGYGLDQFDEVRVRGLVALGLAGLVVGLVGLGKLSPAAPLTAGVIALTASVLYELGTVAFLPVLRPVFASGAPILVGVLLLLLAWRRR